MFKKILATIIAVVTITSSFNMPVNAAETDTVEAGDIIEVTSIEDLQPGTYNLDAELSCYVSAMGGVEFGASLLTGTVLEVGTDGTANVTLTFGTSSVTIYTITCDTYVGEAYYTGARTEGTIGYYDGTEWKDAEYTLSDETVTPSYKSLEGYSTVNYVDSMTFSVAEASDTYQLGLVVDSSVMGMQFGGSDDAKYDATLTVDWSNVEVVSLVDMVELDELQPGKYKLNAELSCYVSAMGGVEFGASLLTDAILEVKLDGTANITLTFGTSSVTIYGITCYTYVGEAYYLSGARTEGTIGYYDGTEWKEAEYTLSDETVTPSYKSLKGYSEVNYIDSMNFPVSESVSEYQLGLVVDSSVMGMQFGGSDDARYDATLSVDWSEVETIEIYEIPVEEEESSSDDKEEEASKEEVTSKEETISKEEETTEVTVNNDTESENIVKNSKVEGMEDKLVVKLVEATNDDYKLAVEKLGNKIKFAIFDLSLESGKQPVAGTKITVPVMEAIKDAKFVKVSVIKDGKFEEVAVVKVVDGKITFEPKHFSTYVFSEATADEYNAANTTTVKTSPNTGDASTFGMTLTIALLAGAVVVMMGSKRKENIIEN